MDQYTETPQIKRPLFLTVLCILSFIGSSFQLTSNFGSYRLAKTTAENPEALLEVFETLEDAEWPPEYEHIPEMLEESILENNTEKKIKHNSLGLILSGLLTLIGVFAMWRLRRWGYYMYVVGIILYITTPWIAFSGVYADILGYVALFIGLLFTALYSFNLKHLR